MCVCVCVCVSVCVRARVCASVCANEYVGECVCVGGGGGCARVCAPQLVQITSCLSRQTEPRLRY